MTACVDLSPNLPARTSKRFSYPFATAWSAPVSPSRSGETSPRSVARATSPTSGGTRLTTSSKSLPSLAILATDLSSPISPINLEEEGGEQQIDHGSEPTTPRAVRAGDAEQITPRKGVSPRKSQPDLKRSASMPAVAEAETDDAPFPSPSSSFRAPPTQEAELIKEILDSRTRVQSDGTRRPKISVETGPSPSNLRSPSSSRGGTSRAPPGVSSPVVRSSGSGSRSRKASLRDSESSLGGYSQPMSATSSQAEWSISSRPPSRPPSAYAEPVVPLTPGLARRLSLSASRRGSENLIQQTKRVVIRDFAFAMSDPRYWGEGMQATLPAASRGSSGFWSSSASSSRAQLQSWDEVANDVQEELTSRGSTSTFSWGFITSHAEADAVDQMADSPINEEDEDDDEETLMVDLGPIPEGGALFIATYAFDPEADQEMGLSEGEVVRVYERICQGWVVAGRLKQPEADSDTDDETGLVPENYLAPYREATDDL